MNLTRWKNIKGARMWWIGKTIRHIFGIYKDWEVNPKTNRTKKQIDCTRCDFSVPTTYSGYDPERGCNRDVMSLHTYCPKCGDAVYITPL